MVLEEISELMEDCNSKRQILKDYRESLQNAQKGLLKFASQNLPKDDLSDLEHFQNQFHIQLINIHDLRHDYKAYQQRLKVESQLHGGITDEILQKQKELRSQYEVLEDIIKGLNKNFEEFLQKPA